MTIKELYEWAKLLGAEDFKIKARLDTEELAAITQLRLDYISHGDRVVVLTNKHK